MAVIRDAHLGDLDVIVNYNTLMARESEGLELVPADITEGVRKVLSGTIPGARYYLAEVQGAVVGQLMITTEWSDWRNKDMWWIQSVYTHPDHRGQGIFKQLYHHVKSLGQQQGAGGLRLYADLGNQSAQATYEKLGMTSHYKIYEATFWP